MAQPQVYWVGQSNWAKHASLPQSTKWHGGQPEQVSPLLASISTKHEFPLKHEQPRTTIPNSARPTTRTALTSRFTLDAPSVESLPNQQAQRLFMMTRRLICSRDATLDSSCATPGLRNYCTRIVSITIVICALDHIIHVFGSI